MKRWSALKRVIAVSVINTVAFVGTYIALCGLTTVTITSALHTLALLGITFFTGHLNITFTRLNGKRLTGLDEAGTTIALVGGDPSLALPGLFLLHLHRCWTSGRHPTTIAFGLEMLVMFAWIFYAVDLLGQPGNLTFVSLLQALPWLGLTGLVGMFVRRLIPKTREIHKLPRWRSKGEALLDFGLRVIGAAAGVLLHALDYEMLSIAGVLLLLVAALAVPTARARKFRTWSKLHQLLEDWKFTDTNAQHAVQYLHLLAPSRTHVLFVMDSAARVTYRAWVPAYGRRARVETLPGSLKHTLQADSTTTQDGYGRGFSPPRFQDSTILSGQKVALIQSIPPVTVSLPPHDSVYSSPGVPLVLKALLDTLDLYLIQQGSGYTTATGLSLLTRDLDDGFAVVDEHDRIQVWNKSLEHYTGIPAVEALGCKLHEQLAGFRTKEGSVGQPLIITRNHEDMTFFLYVSSYEVPLGGEPARLYAFHDVNDLVAARESQYQFFSFVLHELHNPATALHLQIDEFEERLGEDDVMVADLRSAVNRLTQHLRDLSTASERNVSRQTPSMSAEGIPASALVKFPWMRKTQELFPHLEVVGGVDFDIQVDIFRVRQIITNLVSNAAKYSPEGAPVRLSYGITDDGTSGYFRVVDEGSGVPENSREVLFESYYRGGNTQHIPGHGLGLALSHHLALQMGGALTHAPNTPKGSVFTLTVPFQPPDPESKAQL